MHVVNITTAKSHLSSLIRQIEDDNEDIIIERAGRPIVKMVKYHPAQSHKRIGMLNNQISISDDFDELPDEIAVYFGLNA